MTLKRRTLINICTTLSQRAVAVFFGLLSNILFARLLAPLDFGIVGICQATVQVAGRLPEAGLGPALIYSGLEDRRTLGTALTLNCIFSMLLYSLIYIGAPYIAVFYSIVGLAAPLRVAGIVVLIATFALIQKAVIQKRLQHSRLFWPGVSATAVSSGVGLICAWWGWGYWSVIVLLVTQAATETIILNAVFPSLFKLAWDRDSVAKLMHYGGQLTVAGLAAALIGNIDKVVLGRVVGLEALGSYVIAYKWAHYFAKDVSGVFQTVFFPTFVKIRESSNTDALKRAFLKSVSYQNMVLIPACIFLVVFAPEFVLNVLGPQWQDAIVPLQILTPFALIRGFARQCNGLFAAWGRPAVIARDDLCFLVILTLGLTFISPSWGIIGAASVILVCSIGWYVLWRAYVLHAVFGIPVRQLGRQFHKQVLGSLLAVCTVAALKSYLGMIDENTLLNLLLGATSCAVLYGIYLVLTMRAEIVAVWAAFFAAPES